MKIPVIWFDKTERRASGKIMKKAVEIFSVLLYLAVAAAAALIVYYNIKLPDNYYITEGGKLEFDSSIGVMAAVSATELSECSADFSESRSSEVTDVQLKLFGIFPIKDVSVREVSEAAVIPCGTPFGIKLLTDGVMVVEIVSFESGGQLVSPASDAGITEGDVIVSVSGKPVSSTADITSALSGSGGNTVGVKIRRDDVESVVFLKPEISSEDDCYHAGMWVRDSSAGIGTMTFYDPSSGCFAGLGHPVCDIDTGEILPLCSGESADVIISGIKKGTEGAPGELMGAFITDSRSGTIEINSSRGLFGRMDKSPVFGSALPVAMRQEVQTGEAVILSTIKGCAPSEYSISIEKIDLTDSENSHNMVIRVTDEELISEAGGIVQGMSGSPIIQNGKIVGAVTHVFVNDPLKGYAIFADSMYDEMQSLNPADTAA